jgi:hypothetical protein
LSWRRPVVSGFVVPVLDTERSIVDTGSGTGFVGESSRRRWGHWRWEPSFWDHIARTRDESCGHADK